MIKIAEKCAIPADRIIVGSCAHVGAPLVRGRGAHRRRTDSGGRLAAPRRRPPRRRAIVSYMRQFVCANHKHLLA